jgi:hypothetical protein
MRVRSRRGLTAVVAAAVVMASFGGVVRAQTAGPPDPDTPAPLYTINGLGPTKGDNVVLRWDEELLQSIRANPGGTGPTVTARALGVAHTSMFDAWAAYDARAFGTRYGGTLRRPPAERTLENKNKAPTSTTRARSRPSTGPTGRARSSRPATGRCSPRPSPASAATAWTTTSSCSSPSATP